MLDIFGSRDDKKEDLKKNMDKIRDMVGEDSTGSRDDQQPRSPQDQQQQQRQQGQQRQQTQQQQGEPLPPPPDHQGQQRQQGQDRPVQARGRQPQQSRGGQDGQQRADEGVSPDQIPEAPETKEIEVPDIQKGPLFIRVRKFKEAKQMVSRMRELNEDMETQMGGLRNTLEEDQETTRRLNDAMKRLQDSMNTIRDIVSPG